MRGAIGPILTTGVALAAAGVVVANPIVAPRADIQIPAVQLSAGSGDAAAMLDQAFLDAIAPSPPESTNPFSVLRQLISSLAADASYLGKNAIVEAFVAGVTAVTQPELTASSTPYYPSLVNSPELAASVLPGLDVETLSPLVEAGAEASGAVTMAAEAVPPAVQTLVAGVVNDAGFVGGQIVVAAFAAGAVVAAEPGLIGDALVALISGDFNGALQTAVKAVAAPLGPAVIILNALREVVEKNLGAAAAVLSAVAPALSATAGQPDTAASIPAAPQQPAAAVTTAPSPAVAATPGDASTRTARNAATSALAKSEATESTSAEPTRLTGAVEQDSAAALTAAATRSQLGGGADTDAAPGPTVGSDTDPTPAEPTSPLRGAVNTVQQQVGAALSALGTAAGAGSDTTGAATEGGNRSRAGKANSAGS